MTEEQEIKVKAMELAILALGPQRIEFKTRGYKDLDLVPEDLEAVAKTFKQYILNKESAEP
jgi:hypothetical protein